MWLEYLPLLKKWYKTFEVIMTRSIKPNKCANEKVEPNKSKEEEGDQGEHLVNS